MVIGACNEKLGKKDAALENYKKARDYGKKVTYKSDFSGADKAIERLSK